MSSRIAGFLLLVLLALPQSVFAQSGESDFSVLVSDGVDQAAPGTDVTYTVTATNGGPDAGDYVLTLPLPVPLTFAAFTEQSSSGAVPTTPASGTNGTVTVTGTLGALGSATFQIVAHLPPSSTPGDFVTLVGSIAANGPLDPNSENDSSADSFQVAGAAFADFGVSVSDGIDAASPDTDVTYTIVVTNGGPERANYSFGATLPGDLTFVSLTAPAGTSASTPAVGAGGTVTGSGTLAAGGSATFLLRAHVPASASSGTEYSMTVTVTPAGVIDPNNENDSSTASFVVGSSDLSVAVSDSSATAVPGTTVAYTITAANDGPDASTYVLTLPTGTSMTFVGLTQTSGPSATLSPAPEGQTGTATASGLLPASTTATFELVLKVLSSATGSASFTASIAGEFTADPDPADNSQIDTNMLTPRSELSIAVSNGVASVVAGTLSTYRVTVLNAGPSDSPYSMTATMSSNATFVGFVQVAGLPATATTPAAGSSGSINVSGNVDASSPSVFDLTVRIASGSGPTVTIGGVVFPSRSGDASANNIASDSDAVTRSVDLSVVLSGPVSLPPGHPGAVFTAAITNAGPSDSSYALSFTPPPGMRLVRAAGTSGSLAAGSATTATITLAVDDAPPPAATLTVTVSDGAVSDSSSIAIRFPQYRVELVSAPSIVERGQQDVAVEVTLLNDSSADALQFSSTTIRFAPDDAGYSVTPPASVAPIAPGARAVLTYIVDIGAPQLGSADITWSGTAVTTTGAFPAGLTSSVAGRWTVVEPPVLSIETMTIATASVVQGAPVGPVSFSARNTGQTTAQVSSAGLLFNGSAAGFTVARLDGVVSIAPGSVETFSFDVSSTSTAPLGLTTVSPVLVPTRVAVGVSVATTLPELTVLRPAGLELGSLVFAPASVRRGGSTTGSFTISNPGEEALTVTSISAEGTVLATLPFSVAGGGSATVSVRYDVGLTSAVGLVTTSVTVSTSGGLSRVTTGSFAVTNNPPVAAAPAPQSGTVGTVFTLDGRNSSDVEGTPLTYQWTVVARPQGSSVSSSSFSTDAGLTQLTPDRKGVYTIGLSVSDGLDSSPVATTAITILDSAPVASIAPVSPVTVGVAVQLDGSASSDPNAEDTLVYTWSLIDGPGTVTFSPNGTTGAARTSFTPATAGTYTIGLVVNDGALDSPRAQVSVSVTPRTSPLARILSQSSSGGPQVIVLDASSSRSFGEGNSIASYAWSLSAAPSGASPFTSATPQIAYSASRAGDYLFTLTVADSFGSTDDQTFAISISDVPPVASAGSDRVVNLPGPGAPAGSETTSAIQLDGRLSSDANGDAIAYRWSFTRAPDRSAAAADTTTLASFDSPASATPRLVFRTDLTPAGPGAARSAAAGSYGIRLTVTAGGLTDTADIQVDAIGGEVLLPFANAGLPALYEVSFRTGAPRPAIRLDGTASADPQGLPLTYEWAVVAVPAGSAPTLLADAGTPTPSFVPDRPGLYSFELVVNNAFLDSAPSRVSVFIVSAEQTPPFAAPIVEDLARLRQAGPFEPALAFVTGDRVVLNGTASTALATGASLTAYAWTQTRGPSVSLTPASTAPTVSFIATAGGRYGFRLTVTDSNGSSSLPVEVQLLVLAPGQPAPALSIVASASTTTATASDLGETVADGVPSSLRVTLPTTVTLTATPVNLPAGQRYAIAWRQIAGPAARLSSTGVTSTAPAISITSFSPTTAGAHLFEAELSLLDGTGAPTGISVTRVIAVLVDSATARVPGVVASAVILGRSVSLSGSAFSAAAGVTYVWYQIEGPPAVIADPDSPVTSVTLPVLPDGQPRRFRFALVAFNGSLQGLATIVTVTAQGTAPATPTPPAVFFSGGGGGGCALDRSGAARRFDLLILLLPAWGVLLGKRRRSS